MSYKEDSIQLPKSAITPPTDTPLIQNIAERSDPEHGT